MNRRVVVAVPALVAAACQAPPASAPKSPVPVRHALDAGATVLLEPVATPTAGGIEPRAVTAMLHEALRQSRRLDFAGGVEACDAPWRLVTTLDGAARSLATSLRDRDGRQLPLAAAQFEEQPLDAAIDDLALRTRGALGDPEEAAPIAVVFSDEPACVIATDEALTLLARGRAADAKRLLERARRVDAGSTVTLAALAAAALDSGDVDASIQLANDTLRHLESRLAATTELRAARTLLLARAARANRVEARVIDEKLLELGAAAIEDRPHDPHAHFTYALALSYLGRFEESAPRLRSLRARWPLVGGVAYHLAFAELAIGRPAAALAILDDAGEAIPADRALLPRSLATFNAGDTERLRADLARELERARSGGSPRKVHELLRMVASLEILAGDSEAAARYLLDDLDWLRHHPSLLPQLAAEVAENGEVLARLGHGQDLSTAIEALQEVAGTTASVSQALTYLAGLVLVRETDAAPTTALATLNQERKHVWATLLRAAAHRQRGELVDEARELSTAIRISDSALVRAELSRTLSELGRTDQARRLLEDLRTRLLAVDLRRPLDHPLLSPGRALAYLATE